MVARSRVAGFTLLELLISITILGLVIGIASFSFSLFTRHWEGPRSGFERASGQAQRLDLLQRALTAALPWVVRDNDGRLGFYFLGREEGLTLVTASPIYTVGAPAVIRVFREPEDGGGYRLVYEEASLAETLLRDGSQTLPFRYRLIVLEGVRDLSFRYFGWESLQSRLQADEGEVVQSPRWWPDYDGLTRVEQPQRVGMRLGGFEAIFAMSDRSSALINRATPQL
jgi:prepilin-type N-terminal cleavage/methylation domain-containing protein